MEQTRDALIKDVKGLSAAQINFKADSTRWSVAQCVEHIALAEVALDSFVARRNRNIEFVKTTQDDLRDHYFQNPGLGTIDDYQTILFMTAHSKRHTLQLEEVKASPNFPKN